MGDFRQSGRSNGFGRDNRGGGRFGGERRGGFSRGRDFNRGPSQMFDAQCSKCGKECQVPFRPTGNKPVFCSECFRPEGRSEGRNERRPEGRFERTAGGSAVSSDQLGKINAKLDKILLVLKDLEIAPDDEELDDSSDDSSEEHSEENEDGTDDESEEETA